MSFESVLRDDILDPEIIKKSNTIKIISETYFKSLVGSAHKDPTKTPNSAKNIIEAMGLIKIAIEDYGLRTQTTEDSRVNVLYESPDVDAELETITIMLDRREPGMHGQGRPFGNEIKQLRPIIREEVDDPDHPGYKRAVLGYFYDNMVRLTAWARTNKAANERALWIETVMEEYAWFFGYSGINRVLYQGRGPEQLKDVNNNKIYGRPIDYYIRTEKLRSVSQKQLEELCIRLAITT